MAATEQEKTPLQQKLDEFGEQLSKVGVTARQMSCLEQCYQREAVFIYSLSP